MTTAVLYNCTTVPLLHNCTTVPLYHCCTVQLNCETIMEKLRWGKFVQELAIPASLKVLFYSMIMITQLLSIDSNHDHRIKPCCWERRIDPSFSTTRSSFSYPATKTTFGLSHPCIKSRENVPFCICLKSLPMVMAGQCLYVAWKHGDDWSVFVSSWNPPKNCPWFHRYPVSIQTLWRIILKFVETQNKFKISAKKHNLSRCTEVGFHHFSHRNVKRRKRRKPYVGWGFFFQFEIYIWSRMVLQGGEGEKEGLERLGATED